MDEGKLDVKGDATPTAVPAPTEPLSYRVVQTRPLPPDPALRALQQLGVRSDKAEVDLLTKLLEVGLNEIAAPAYQARIDFLKARIAVVEEMMAAADAPLTPGPGPGLVGPAR